jgi:hypothetical protein
MESKKESKKNSILVIMFNGFRRAISHLRKFTRKWFGPYIVHYVLPNNIVLLVTIEKFKTNPMLVNVNKLKCYKYMESKVHKQEHMLVYWEKNASGV